MFFEICSFNIFPTGDDQWSSLNIREVQTEAENLLQAASVESTSLVKLYMHDFVRLTQAIYHTQAELQYMVNALCRLCFIPLIYEILLCIAY